jgi:two-component system LytT family response regulator
MPELDGFDVLERAVVRRAPLVIFVTAFDRYAVRAFDASAADYLLKPFSAVRLQQALGRARARLPVRSGSRELVIEQHAGDEALKSLTARADDRGLIVRAHKRVTIIRFEQIEWIESVGNYVGIHTSSSRMLMRETMARVGARLDTRNFVRIHRGAIVNLRRVVELRSTSSRRRVVTLRSGARLRVSRRYRAALEAALGLNRDDPVGRTRAAAMSAGPTILP